MLRSTIHLPPIEEGEFLLCYVKEKHISKNKLCEACNLQRTQLNNYCKNKVTRIDFTILAKLCEFLDCTPNDILKLK